MVSDIVVGDVVWLKSGGPAMVVESISSHYVAYVAWFREGAPYKEAFKLAALKKSEGKG